VSDTQPAPGTPIAPPPDFPVEWASPEDATLHWTRDPSHTPGPVPPLQLLGEWVRHGIRHGWRYWEVPYADSRRLRINTFEFSAAVPLKAPAEELAAMAERAERRLEHLVDHVADQWTEDWLPRINASLQVFEGLPLDAADPDKLVRALEAASQAGRRLWEVHFELVFGCGYIRRQFDAFCRDLFGADTEYGVAALTAGDENWSVANAEALRRLAEWVHAHPELETLILDQPWSTVSSRLDHVEGGAAFRAQFLDFIAVHGKKTVGELLAPTWEEDPEIPLNNLRALLRLGGDFGAANRHAVIARRIERLDAVRRALQDYPRPVAAEFERLLQAARVANRLMEDHNYYIDQQSAYWGRRVILAFGRGLEARGTLDRAADVLYLEAQELAPALQGGLGDLRPLVAERQAEMARWKDRSAPLELGMRASPLPPHPLLASRRDEPDETPPSPRDPSAPLSGIAASPGVYEGPARVVSTLADADRLQPGDILVTTTTSPSWSTWYPILGALVTETGGALTHAAVVAREFAIPAVVAVPGATRRLRTGMRLRVDGGAGRVEVLDESTP
jgi:phosphohistidine swiveling domain-containing protein